MGKDQLDSSPERLQAALVHAQFEAIHPFTDGNGRVGRALIHTGLTRRGLTSASVLPVSLVLATLGQTYVGGLTSCRYEGASDSDAAHRAVEAWLRVFLDAAILAAEQAQQISADVAALAEEWTQRVHAHRTSLGRRASPRTDSATPGFSCCCPRRQSRPSAQSSDPRRVRRRRPQRSRRAG
ncbi:Fic family protein [Modestobacter sp. DSM 44400]|uniref:Fic family protein n=1 Tax=Modestobacter sp. DSM 44400 TaxID=1550230 RepID=UPI0020C8E484|nr:Fic family protein [Modestobacter sp. DSM 44400]